MLGLCVPLVIAVCPNIEDEPVLYPSDETLFTCADLYFGPGNEISAQACTTCEEEGLGQSYSWNGEDALGEAGSYLYLGSLVVMPGCSFYAFSEASFGGDITEYGSGQVIPMVDAFTENSITACGGKPIYGIGSYKCQCVQELIECDPEDHYVDLASCTAGSETNGTECDYTVYVGTIYADESLVALAVSQGVAAEIKGGLAELYAMGIGVSEETDFNWISASDATFDIRKLYFSGSFTVEPGMSVWLLTNCRD